MSLLDNFTWTHSAAHAGTDGGDVMVTWNKDNWTIDRLDFDELRCINNEYWELSERLYELRTKRAQIIFDAIGYESDDLFTHGEYRFYPNNGRTFSDLWGELIKAGKSAEDIAAVFGQQVIEVERRQKDHIFRQKAKELLALTQIEFGASDYWALLRYWQDHDVYAIDQARNIPDIEYLNIYNFGRVKVKKIRAFLEGQPA